MSFGWVGLLCVRGYEYFLRAPVDMGLVWTGLDWVRLGWTGLDWVGLGWIGLGWFGLGQILAS